MSTRVVKPTETYVATVQVVLRPGAVGSHGEACDWFSGLLSEHQDVLDWAYLKVGGQQLGPTETLVPDPYQEGDFLL